MLDVPVKPVGVGAVMTPAAVCVPVVVAVCPFGRVYRPVIVWVPAGT